ncbi:MAG: tRNA (adenosine(37)-N6)-threonylcarbamoyltransferase complex ATPase subunit type 1 TsaE [Candidatus Marinimicrobia bacterium]|nr:tRNA (adenosine(37)-N6)-threonylcarbamoyltransferase complex ATPase subunit type 1 TsaE [Candidatus Neomarinimicrobiota bacterium]
MSVRKYADRKRYFFLSVEETQAFAADYATGIPPGSVIALIGDLGTGKTTFTQGFARGLGITEQVGSPTFKIVSEYKGDHLILYHVDCYRLKNGADFLNIGGETLLNPDNGVTVIEWADIIEEILPAEAIVIHFSRIPGKVDQRGIIIEEHRDEIISI